MKKNLFYIAGIAMSMFFAACSSSDDLASNGANGEGGQDLGTSYISVALNTPTESSMASRAENDNFDDGMAAEYRVRQAILVLFQQAGSSEADYKYFGAYNIPVNPQLFNPVNDQITSRGVSAIKIANLADNMYALVVANPNGILTINEGKLMFNGDGTPVEITTAKTFADFNGEFAKVLSATNNMVGNDGQSQDGLLITMCNTPYVAGTKGGSVAATGSVKTLAKVDASKLFATEQEALNSAIPTTEIFLERAVAKVTLSANSGQMAGTTDAAHQFSVMGWLLDNTNASSYLVRNTEAATTHFGLFSDGTTSANSKYRFVGYLPFSFGSKDAEGNLVTAPGSAAGTEAMFRYYWAKDPNYNTAGTFNTVQFAEGKSNDVTFLPIDETRPQYCFENTFDIQHQIWSETTRVIIRAKFNNGVTFYTINQDDSKLYTEGDLKKHIAGRVIHYMNEMVAADRMKITAGDDIDDTNWSTYFTVDLSSINASTQIVTPVAALTTAGQDRVENYNYGNGTPEQTAARGAMDEVFADVRAENTNIQRYLDGICYYQARIKHFGDDVTPWNNWEAAAGLTAPKSGNTATIYPNQGSTADVKNYLGRYGIVRNNWYALNVSAVKRIGSPVIPSISGTDGDTPDDELDSYISVRINIMSWAKRVQDIEF